jgi:hypothetical protein
MIALAAAADTPTDTAADAADYARLRDRIEAASALTRICQASVEILDDEICDTMPISAKAEAADRIWSALIAEISRLDV